jgi:hypothetical protein
MKTYPLPIHSMDPTTKMHPTTSQVSFTGSKIPSSFSPFLGTGFPFLRLPAEIRTAIYEYVVGEPQIRIHVQVQVGYGISQALSTRFYHSGDKLRSITNLWYICKQIYHESYTLSVSRMVFSFGNHLVTQDFFSKMRGNALQESMTTVLFNTLSEFEKLPVEDLRRFVGLVRLAILCGEKTRWEWILWDEMPREQRNVMRIVEKHDVRERVRERVEEAFPEKVIDIQVGHPPSPVPIHDEKLLELYWDGGKML